jgi:hypothetical protein
MLNQEEMKSLAEQMAEHAHDAWRNKRREEKHWHTPDECPNRGFVCLVCRVPILHGEESRGDIIRCQDCGNKQKAGYPTNVYCYLCKPLMCKYSELPESEKELARAYPVAFFSILEEMGYEVVRKSEDQEEDPEDDGEDAAE